MCDIEEGRWAVGAVLWCRRTIGRYRCCLEEHARGGVSMSRFAYRSWRNFTYKKVGGQVGVIALLCLTSSLFLVAEVET